MALHLNLAVCHRCPDSQLGCHGPCACNADPARRDIIERAAAGDCEKFVSREADLPPIPVASSAAPAIDYAYLWRMLHERPTVMIDLSREAEWMNVFTGRLPCGDCKRHWLELLEVMPPDYTSRDAYFAWTVAAHNSVNRRLGKPEMGLAEARAIHATSA